MQIGSVVIGPEHPPFFIAEMSGNHNHSLDRALQIVDAMAAAGAHALKLQTYTAETMTLDIAEREFRIDDPDSLWAGQSLYALYELAHTPWEWHAPLFARARALGMQAFSTPFDESAVDFLETLDVPCYKIASFENVDLPLLRKVAATGKPVILSTGMASLIELGEAVSTLREAGCRDLVLLRCVSSYPAPPEESHLRTLAHMREAFGCEVGLSDHTLGIGTAIAAVAMGASVVEKHVTLRRADGGVDSAFSLEPGEVRMLVQEMDHARRALGGVRYGPGVKEAASLQFRRTLYVSCDIKAGERLSAENVRAIRPGLGLLPKYLPQVLGRRVVKDIARGTPVAWEWLD